MFKKHAYKAIDNRLKTAAVQLLAVLRLHQKKHATLRICQLLLAIKATIEKIISTHYQPALQR